jgi:hypothetical protein
MIADIDVFRIVARGNVDGCIYIVVICGGDIDAPLNRQEGVANVAGVRVGAILGHVIDLLEDAGGAC